MFFVKRLPPLAVVVFIALQTAAVSPAAVSSAERSALDWAFQFASAIETDQADQTRAQADVIDAYLASGAFEAATNRVDQISTWRRGAGWAEIATAFANRGNTNAALQAINRAEKIRAGVHGDWQKPRVTMHLARAYVACGNFVKARELMATLPPEEAVPVQLAIVRQLLRDNQQPAALDELKRGRGSKNFMVDAALVEGYIEVSGKAEPSARRELFAETLQRFDTLPGLPQVQLAPALAVGLFQSGDQTAATNLLMRMEKLLESAEPRFRAAGVAKLAIAWGQIGVPKHQQDLLRQASQLAVTGDPMDQPATCAVVAEILAESGKREDAWKLYQYGLDTAAQFANSRPRALAIVEICRSMGRHGFALDAAWNQRLKKLLDGLGEPW